MSLGKKNTSIVVLTLLAFGLASLSLLHQKQNAASVAETEARFKQRAAERIEQARASTEELEAARGAFSLRAFENKEKLQAELERILPYATPVEAADALLAEREGAFRSDNLIEGWPTGLLTRGSSSADNYVYYYKPAVPAGDEGWENTSNGWVIKVTHGTMPKPGDDHLWRSMGGSGEGVKRIEALSVPSDGPTEQVELAKELLQYKIDLTPVDRFDEGEWAALVKEHENSPCRTNFTYDCLRSQLYGLLDVPEGNRNYYTISWLAGLAIDDADKEAGKILLAIWPTEEAIRRKEESLPRLRRLPEYAIDNLVLNSLVQQMKLFFLTGRTTDATARLLELHEQRKSGIDYGIVSTLVDFGDFEEAYRIAGLALEWERIAPDPNENSSALGHCEVYRNTRPEGMGKLALAYVGKDDLPRAYEIASMIAHYWENDAFGQKSFCYTEAAKRGYLTAMQALLKAHAERGEKERARELYEEMRSMLERKTEKVRRYNKWAFEQIVRTAAESGVIEDAQAVADFINSHNEIDYPKIYSRSTYDPVAMMYAMTGDYNTAIMRIESYRYSENAPPQSPLEKLVQLKETPDNEIRLTTFLKIADALARAGDRKGAMLFLDKATPYFGTRKPEYDHAVTNLSDHITKANILMEIGEKEKSREMLDELLEKFAETSSSDYRGGTITTSFYGQLALLYAHHADIGAVQAWADTLPTFYHGGYYARIASLLAEEERWDEFDQYVAEMERALSTDQQPIQNWHSIFNVLIETGQFERYMRFVDMVDEPSKADLKRQEPLRGTVIRPKIPPTPDTQQQIHMINLLLLSGLGGKDVPPEVIADVWPRHIANCRRWSHIFPRQGDDRFKSPDARETMAACYAQLMQSAGKQ